MRKIKNLKKIKKDVSREEVYKQINIGLDMIRTVCDKDIYEKFYLLHLDSSPVIEEAFLFINQGYRIKLLKNSLRSGDYNVLRTNVNTFVSNYLNTYQPTVVMKLYCLFFIFNKWINKYIKLNEYRKIFKKENLLKKELYKEVYTPENYRHFDKIFKLNITKDDEITPAFNTEWMLEFKHISELLKWNLVILDRYREKLYVSKLLKNYVEKNMISVTLVKNDIPNNLDKFFERKLIFELRKYFLLIKDSLKSAELKSEMLRVNKINIEEVLIDIKYIKDSMKDIESFLFKFLYLLITGETELNSREIRSKVKSIIQINNFL